MHDILKLKENLYINSLLFLSGFSNKKQLLPLIKNLKISWDDIEYNNFFMLKYELLENRTQNNWKVLEFHTHEILGGSRIPATIVLEKISNNERISFSFSDQEYVQIFFKRFSLIIENELDDGDSSSSKDDSNKKATLKPKL